MNKKLLGAGAALLLGGCASVEMAQYTVTSFPEVALKASEKKPASLKFVSNSDGLDSLVGVLKSEFGKRKDFRVVEEAADYWFVLGGAQQYLKGKAHKKYSVVEKDGENGGSEVVVDEGLNLASAAKIVSVAVYETKSLAPVHYFEIPLYSGDNSEASAKSENDYAEAFSKDVVERIMDVFLQQKKDVETPMPNEADGKLRELFAKKDYKAFDAQFKALRIDLKKLLAAAKAVEDGKADDATKEYAKDIDAKLGAYYLNLLVMEAKTMDAKELENIYNEQLAVLEATEAKGLAESCPVALARLEYKLANLNK